MGGREERHVNSIPINPGDTIRRALMPLEAEWIRNFMLQRDNAAQHLQVLTAPIPNEKACLYSEVLLFQGLQSVLPAVWSVTSACLMLPCASNGSNEVGLVVRREERLRNHANSSSAVNQESHLITEHTVGRFHFSRASGLLILTSDLVPDIAQISTGTDILTTHVASMCGDALFDRKSRLLWWPPAFLEISNAVPQLFNASILTELLEKEQYDECVLIAMWCSLARASSEFARDPMGMHGKAPKESRASSSNGLQLRFQCQYDAKVLQTQLSHESVACRVRDMFQGQWSGTATTCLCPRERDRFLCQTNLSASISIDDLKQQNMLARQLRQLAIGRFSDSLRLSRLLIPAAGEEGLKEGFKGTMRVEGNHGHASQREGSFGIMGRGQILPEEMRLTSKSLKIAEDTEDDQKAKKLAREERLEFRRERNRRSAERCNRERADRIAALRNSLQAARKLMVQLKTTEMEARILNIELKSRLAMRQARR